MESWLGRDFRLNNFSGFIGGFKGRAFSPHRYLWLPEECGKCLTEGRESAVIWCPLHMKF